MPYVIDDEDQLQQGALGSGVSRLTPGQAAAPMPAPAPAAAPRPGAGSGNWVNIGQYLDANRDVANRTAGELASSIEKDAEGARGGIKGAQEQFGKDVQEGGFRAQRQTTGASRGGAPQKMDVPGDAVTNETVAYGGPSSMADQRGFQDLTQKVSQAQGRVDASGTGYGRQALMQDSFGKSGQYTPGQSAFDSAMVGGVGGRRFHELSQKYGGLRGELDAANKASGDLAANAAANAETAKQSWLTGETQKRAAEEAAQRAAEEAAARKAQQDAMRDNSGHGDLQNSTVSINDEKAAMNDGLYYEWLKAGSPPYDQWKASRGG